MEENDPHHQDHLALSVVVCALITGRSSRSTFVDVVRFLLFQFHCSLRWYGTTETTGTKYGRLNGLHGVGGHSLAIRSVSVWRRSLRRLPFLFPVSVSSYFKRYLSHKRLCVASSLTASRYDVTDSTTRCDASSDRWVSGGTSSTPTSAIVVLFQASTIQWSGKSSGFSVSLSRRQNPFLKRR